MLRNVNRESLVTDGSVSVPMILSGLKRRNAMGTILQTDLLNKASTVCLKTTKFGRVTRAWRGVFLGVRHVPTARKRVSSTPILGVPFY